MSNMFDINFESDSNEENEVETKAVQSFQNESFKQSQSPTFKSGQKQNDKYVPNQISKNILFHQDDDEYIHHGKTSESVDVIEEIVESPKKSTSDRKSIRRKKVDAGIKLQPLKTLELTKKSQTISLVTSPKLAKAQSFEPIRSIQSNLNLDSVKRENLFNLEMDTSSEEEDKANQKVQENLNTPSKKDFNDLNLELSPNVFFEDSDEENKSNKNEENLSKVENFQEEHRNYSKKKEQRNSSEEENQKYKYDEDKNEESDSEEAKVGIENPEVLNSKTRENASERKQEQYLNTINGHQYQQQSEFDNVKNLLLNPLMKNSVINLKLKRKQSFLNYFSPEFRVEFQQDRYFIMSSKKTSSKPSSTFIFSGSESSYDEAIKKYLGKMKSNIGGNVYNIFGSGLNPSNAKERNLPPRELLATVFYRTEFLGTSRPKELIVFVKKPEYLYYRDFRGVRMYDEEIPLNQLYENYPEDRGKIQVFHTRKPVYHYETKEYVMNFEGKVKISSVKNFILEDRENHSEKVILFGKVTEEDFVLDIHSPLTPIVGIGVALTMFDSRIGSD